MKKLYCILALAMCAWMPACSDFTDETPVLPQQEEKLSVQVETLGNGNELWTYPNGVRVERTPAGEFFWQGDILLADWQLEALTAPQTRSLILNLPWTDGIVYYEWDANIAAHTKSNALQAMEEWHARCGLVFIDVTGDSSYPNRIHIYNGDGNHSQIGMVGGRQNLSLSENGSGVGSAIHEIGHALGLKHEQCRADRDEYIVVYYDNIKSDRRHNFDKVSGSAYKTSAAFDYSSVMIYNSYITDPNFVYDPTKPVMLTKEGVAFSRSYTPTDLDVQAINEMYRKKVCTINARSECSLSGSVTGNKGYSYLSACVLRAVPAQNRYFSGWYEDGKRLSTLNPYTFSVTGDRNIIARFGTSNNTYCVETSVSQHIVNTSGMLQFVEGGAVSPGPMNVTSYVTLNFRATPVAGFTFSHWLDLDSEERLSTENPWPVKITRDMRIRAVFTKGGFITVPQN